MPFQPFQLMLGEVAYRRVASAHERSRQGLEFPDQALEQRGLARAVGSQDADPRPGQKRLSHVLDHRLITVADGHVLQAH